MIRKCIAHALALMLISGCNLLPQMQQTRHVNPVLPMSMTCIDLTDHLNRQISGLHQWRSIDTTVSVRLPGGMPHRLSGNIACQAPNFFRLSASSVIAHADLGANTERCWFYVQPGDGNLLTWKHEDAPLMQEFVKGVPRIDPDWLMEVLGVVPLDPEKFELSTGPAGAPELWLTSVTDDYRGNSLRRVIKVDTISGLIREHVIYDHERKPLVRATLKDHKSFQGHLLPQTVRLEFPEMDTELGLRFDKIETNCQLPGDLWAIPVRQNVQVVDVGEVLRRQAAYAVQTPGSSSEPMQRSPDRPDGSGMGNGRVTQTSGPNYLNLDHPGETSEFPDDLATPEWDEPTPGNRFSPTAGPDDMQRQTRKKSRWWPW